MTMVILRKNLRIFASFDLQANLNDSTIDNSDSDYNVEDNIQTVMPVQTRIEEKRENYILLSHAQSFLL